MWAVNNPAIDMKKISNELQKNINIDSKTWIWSCEMDYDELRHELKNLFKSPNPFSLYFNASKIRDKFSVFISCISDTISSGFSLKDEWGLIYHIYYKSSYKDIWIELLRKYLKESKYFDVLNYFIYLNILNKESQYIAKWLLKIYIWESKENIEKFLSKYNSKVSYKRISKIYDDLWINNLSFDIYLNENQIEHFLERIYLQVDKTKKKYMLETFKLIVFKDKISFSNSVKIIWRLINSYSYSDDYIEVLSYINREENESIKMRLDNLVDNYHFYKSEFYEKVFSIINDDSNSIVIDRLYLWKYVKRRIIDDYYSEVKNIFYFHSANAYASKETWSKLKWKYRYNSKLNWFDYKALWLTQNNKAYGIYINQLIELKEMIMDLNSNLFSTFLNPIIYKLVSEKIRVSPSDLYKLKYILLYIFSENYSEYKSMYMFFNQLEVFMWYTKKENLIDKIKVSFSLLTLSSIFFVFAFYYLPIWIFLWILSLFILYSFEFFNPEKFYQRKWNIWLKFFSTLFLVISSYFWFVNFDSYKDENFTTVIEFANSLWTVKTSDFADSGKEFMKASLFNITNNK